mgnify:CR=1 FL=1
MFDKLLVLLVVEAHRQGKGKEPAKESVGRRALRAQKRQQIDKMAAKS